MTTITEAARRYTSERVARGQIQPQSAGKVMVTVKQLVAACGDRPIAELDKEAAESWLVATAHHKASTRALRWSYLNVFCEWCVDEELMPRNPFRRVRPPKPPRVPPRALTRDEVGRILAACPDLRARLIVMLMVQQGLRCAGVAALRVEDVDLEARTMRVREKFDNERVLPITDECHDTLVDYLRRWPAEAGPLVRAWKPNGGTGQSMAAEATRRGLGAGTISKFVSGWMADAGVKVEAGDGKAAHALRHTCATDMIEAGADLVEVRDTLGHTSVATTNRYLGSAVGRLRDPMSGRRYGRPVEMPA